MVSLIGIAAASEERTRRVVGVEATGINACPCAQGLVRGSAAERLLEEVRRSGRGADPRARSARDAQPARTRHPLYVGTGHELDAEDLVGIVVRSMSAPVYELLKRPDGSRGRARPLQPRFVEDSVRLALAGALEAFRRSTTFPALEAVEPRDHS